MEQQSTTTENHNLFLRIATIYTPFLILPLDLISFLIILSSYSLIIGKNNSRQCYVAIATHEVPAGEHVKGCEMTSVNQNRDIHPVRPK